MNSQNSNIQNTQNDFRFKSDKYDAIYKEATDIDTREEYWLKQSEEVFWFKKPNIALDKSGAPFYKWFPNSTTNICYNCLDRHVDNGLGDKFAMIEESAYQNKTKTYTFKEALDHVSRLAALMKNKLNVKKGDRVIIYMPLISEGLFAMLACARIGAIHSVVFGGFAADELKNRIIDSEAVLIITASCGVEPKKKIPYLPVIREALCGKKTQILLLQRPEVYEEKDFTDCNTYDYKNELDKILEGVPCEEMDSNEPLYILYTSGTTGSPKGIVRDIGGTVVALNYSNKYIMDLQPGELNFATSDIGWVVGHSYQVYGPLIRGAGTILFEGKPIGTPDCGVLWRIIEKWRVTSFYTSPTALRAIKKEDPEGEMIKKFAMKTLRGIHMAGERCDPDTINWLTRGISSNILINDSWWQTETGWHMCGNNLNLKRFPVVPGSATRPLPGFNVTILDEETNEVIKEADKFGKVCCLLPMPPSFMMTLWQHDQAFLDKYISEDKKYYITGDAGFFDKNGYLNIMTRIDDIIKTASHRLSTGRIEEVINFHEDIIESAVVGKFCPIKGEIPFAYVVTKNYIKSTEEQEKTIKSVNNKVRNDIGAIASLAGVVIANRLPKTRSGKILRGLLKKMLNRDPYSLPPTIDDAAVLDEIVEILKPVKNYQKPKE